MKPRMSMVTLGVTDLVRSIAFYEQGLGFPCRSKDDNIAFFDLDGTWLGLFGRDALAQDADVSGEGTGFRGVTISHNVHSEQEVDQVMQHAIDAGAGLIKKAQPTSWGGYGGYFSDPDGHLWEVAHNPFSWIGPRDEDTA